MSEEQSAREIFHNAVKVTRKMLGKHEQTANSCYNLALAYLAIGSYPEALKFCLQALSMRLELSDKPLDKMKSQAFIPEDVFLSRWETKSGLVMHSRKGQR